MKIKIDRLGLFGDGVADGPVFAPMTLPGEVVEGDVVGDKMATPRIVEPSPDRVKPPCSHFKSCGGCSMQHLRDDKLAEWKLDVVKNALTAREITAPIRGIHTSPASSRRRASFSGKRTKSGAMVGFHQRASDVLIEVPNCKLLHPDLMASLPILQDLVVTGASRKAEISLVVTLTEGGLDVAVSRAKDMDRGLLETLVAKAEQHDLARLTWNDEPVATRRPPVVQFGKGKVALPPGAFLQATEDGEMALLASVKDAVADAKTVIDLFAGCGTFSLPLAEDAMVRAVEGEGDMLEALDKGWRKAKGLKTIVSETRDLYRRPLLPDEFKKIDAVVLDPPRAGAEAQVAELAKADVAKIAMVSCNPVTFARDAATLIAGGYTMQWVDVVDQFRWSSHIELAAAFTRDKK